MRFRCLLGASTTMERDAVVSGMVDGGSVGAAGVDEVRQALAAGTHCTSYS